MNTLIAFTCLVAAAVAEPQLFYSGVAAPSSYYGGVYPYTSSVFNPLVTKSYATPYATTYNTGLVHSIHKRAAQFPGFPASTSPLLTHAPVVSTYGAYPLTSSSYATPYAATYHTGLVHSIHKRAAPIPQFYKTPASTSPLVYAAATPLISTYGAYPYSAYNGAYNTYPYVY